MAGRGANSNRSLGRGMCAVLRCPALFLLVILRLASGAEAVAQGGSSTATVRLKVMDVLGDDLEPEVSVFQDEFTGKNFANRFHHGEAKHIPFGEYWLHVRSTGFESDYRAVVVEQPEVWVVASLEVGSIADPAFPKTVAKTVAGSIRGVVGSEPVWVRLAGVYPGALVDAKADRSGQFVMTDVRDGQYVVITSQAGRVLDIRELRVRGESVKLVIDLGSKK